MSSPGASPFREARSPTNTSSPRIVTTGNDGTSPSPLRPSPASTPKANKALPPLFWYIEMGDWEKATERAMKHPREVQTLVTLRTKSGGTVSGTKRLALHHACFKLRTVVRSKTDRADNDDAFMQVCNFILLLIQLYPEGAKVRETRHGCLPLHLAAFASCAPRAEEDDSNNSDSDDNNEHIISASVGFLPRPSLMSDRSVSEDTHGTTMTTILAQESYTGTHQQQQHCGNTDSPPNMYVAMKSNVWFSAKREDMAVNVINALLDAFPKGIRVDSEGGRFPLHTACAGRATPRVISTLLQANPDAARYRNKENFLPLHLAAHWGVSHPLVAISLLKVYPDSTLGLNRWNRTPLEEALCMAGENGRPHQAALVRALRKHPTYWTKPPEELFYIPSPKGISGRNLVDTDDTLPDEDDTLEEGSRRYFHSGHSYLLEDTDDDEFEARELALANGSTENEWVNLQTLIRRQQWEEIRGRLAKYPHEAKEHLKIITRGGFVAIGGFTLLHYACERRPPKEVIEALVQAWPKALMTKMVPGGSLPLHVACTWHASPQVVRALCLAEPAACRAADELGNLPLHHAAFSGAMVSAVDAILQTCCRAVLARNLQGSLPADICRRLRHENRKSILSLLQQRKDEVLQQNRQISPPMEGIVKPQKPMNSDVKSYSNGEVQKDTRGGGLDNMIWI